MNIKRSHILSFILIAGIISIKTSGRLDHLLAYNAYMQGEKFQQQGQYELAEKKYGEALKLQPNDEPTRKVLLSFYRDVSDKYYRNDDYSTAASYGEKALAMEPNNIAILTDVAYSYAKLNNYEKAREHYKKILTLDPTDTNALQNLEYMQRLSGGDGSANQATSELSREELIYKYQTAFNKAYMEKNYQKAAEYYKKTLLLDPNNTYANQGLKYVNRFIENDNLNMAINNAKAGRKAPLIFYDLIKTDLSSDVRKKAEGVIDLIWSEQVGQIMLSELWQNKIPIKILDFAENGLFKPSYNGSLRTGEIQISLNYIQNLSDKSLYANQRLHYMNVFMHEMGHAYVWSRLPDSRNSLEEEIGVSMIGYNLSYKLITGSYLSKKQAQELSLKTLGALLADDHRNLPVYGGFNKNMKTCGMPMPYVEAYTDIPAMYKKLLAEGLVTPLASLDKLVK